MDAVRVLVVAKATGVVGNRYADITEAPSGWNPLDHRKRASLPLDFTH